MSAIYQSASSVRERGVSIQFGSFRIAAWHRTIVARRPDRSSDYYPTPLVTWRIGAAAALIMSVLVALGLATNHAVASSRYSVVIPVPAMKAKQVISPVPHVSVSTRLAISPARVKAIAEAQSGEVRGAMRTLPSPDAVRSAGVADAIGSAMLSGELQEWGDPSVGRYGFVVAGQLAPTDHGLCRQMSILTRKAGDADSVEQMERCER